ncbi:hypothetical protein EU803_15090 [Loktanella sp. IMCC34160]|nr:hypothetical protein EU803_15090 [Loktanella sp. IMCC34160]
MDLRLGIRVIGVDTDQRPLTLDDGSHLGYDRKLVATGGRVRRLPDLGVNLDRVFNLRGLDDATRLRIRLDESKAQRGDAAHVAILGGGFIGCELASAARIMGLNESADPRAMAVNYTSSLLPLETFGNCPSRKFPSLLKLTDIPPADFR